MKSWQAAGLAVAVVGGGVWLVLRSGAPTNVPAPVVTQPESAQQHVPAPQTFPCRVVARETVAASTTVSGAVDSVLVDVGTAVTDGQVMAVIGTAARASPALAVTGSVSTAQIAGSRSEAAELQAAVGRLRVKTTAAKAAFDKQDLLNRAGVTPRLVFENARAERDRLAGELASAEEASRLADNALAKLEDLRREQERQELALRRGVAAAAQQLAIAEVHAPVAGMVVERNIAAGELVTDKNRAALFRIAPHPELLRAEFGQDAGLKAGQVVAIRAGGVEIRAVVGDGGAADFESRLGAVGMGTECSGTVRLK